MIKKSTSVLLTATFGGCPLIFFCLSCCIVLQNIQTSKNMQYLKYPVISCEARKAVLQKPQIQRGFQDLAKKIPLGARFVGETLLRFNGSCHAWELHRPAKCLGAWEDSPDPETIPLQKSAGRLGPAPPQLLPGVILRGFCCSLPQCLFYLAKLRTSEW